MELLVRTKYKQTIARRSARLIVACIIFSVLVSNAACSFVAKEGTNSITSTKNMDLVQKSDGLLSLPAGGKIAFVSDRDGNPEIYVMNADGSQQTRLTYNLATDTGPSWSPDGKQIAFLSDRDETPGIYVMDMDGSNLTRLTAQYAYSAPIWSPDGEWVAFSGEGRDIYVVRPDSSQEVQLTNDPVALCVNIG